MSFDDSDRIGQGRDIRFLAMPQPPITPNLTELIAATAGYQIRIYNFTIYNLSPSPAVARLISSSVPLTGAIQVQQTAPWQEVSMPAYPILLS